MKACADCKTEKEETEFYRYQTGHLYVRCKGCHSLQTKRNKEKKASEPVTERAKKMVSRKLARQPTDGARGPVSTGTFKMRSLYPDDGSE